MHNKRNSSPSYQEALQKLLNRTSNPKLGLERMSSLLRTIGFEPGSMKSIQIVGTNGKGSTSAFCESLLRAHGSSVALFTSPHLSSARERIRINKKMVSEEDFVLATHAILNNADREDEASFFECILAMFVWLALRAKVEVLILEAGLGGRLDATTALKASVLGISVIDFDHQNILGDTIEAIAGEKIGAAYEGQRVVSVSQRPEAHNKIQEEARKRGFYVTQAHTTSLALGLCGEHQSANAGLALSLVEALGIKTDEEKIRSGLKNVQWPGRYESLIHNGVKIIFDGAHNPSGIRALNQTLKDDVSIKKQPLILVYGSLQGAYGAEKIALLTEANTFQDIFLHMSHNPRRESSDYLKTLFPKPKGKIGDFLSWDALIERAKETKAAILVCGSLYTVGELRGQLLGLPCDHIIPNF